MRRQKLLEQISYRQGELKCVQKKKEGAHKFLRRFSFSLLFSSLILGSAALLNTKGLAITKGLSIPLGLFLLIAVLLIIIYLGGKVPTAFIFVAPLTLSAMFVLTEQIQDFEAPLAALCLVTAFCAYLFNRLFGFTRSWSRLRTTIFRLNLLQTRSELELLNVEQLAQKYAEIEEQLIDETHIDLIQDFHFFGDSVVSLMTKGQKK